MKITPLVLVVSLVANLGLASLVYSRRSEPSVAAEPRLDASSKKSPIEAGASSSAAAAPADPREDDAAYLAQLRADGFPPEIIRTLVYARLQQRYSDRIRAVRGKSEMPYWRSNQMDFYAELSTEDRAAIRSLYKEMSAEAKALLGDGDEALHPYEKDRRERTMGNLSSAKVRQLEAINTDYNELTTMVRERTKGGIVLKADREKLRLLEREKRADLAAVLTPEELVEYDLRASPAAGGVRNRLRNFEPSELEFRAIAALYVDLDLKYGGPSNLSAAEQAARQAAEKELPAKLQSILSPERYAEYQVTTDGAYRQTTEFMNSAKLDPKLARDVIAMKQEITRRGDAIRDDPALTPEQRAAGIAALGEEASSRLTKTLGDSNFVTYKKSAGTWMNRFNAKPASPPRP
ncbi:MAG TPA: hypothetical protein VHO24_00590 [Opitutaceae bacterium]|nr:hypothetical protein [Opitutaceae bacterium]